MAPHTYVSVSQFFLSSPNLLVSYNLPQWMSALPASSTFLKFKFFNEKNSNLKILFLYRTVLEAQDKLAFLVKEGAEETQCSHSGSQFVHHSNPSTFHSASNTLTACATFSWNPSTNYSHNFKSHPFNPSLSHLE